MKHLIVALVLLLTDTSVITMNFSGVACPCLCHHHSTEQFSGQQVVIVCRVSCRSLRIFLQLIFHTHKLHFINDSRNAVFKGYEQSGVEISGGEAQKIALARALYKDSSFILLDEPTAALDPISEYEVYSNFNSISGDKTTVYISHRLASFRFCDKIAVFDNGQIVQVGNHNDLVMQNGKYHELWNAQTQYYKN